MTGAQYEIRIDGTARTYRDRKDYAMEAARCAGHFPGSPIKEIGRGAATPPAREP